MPKLVLLMMVSLDGYYEAPGTGWQTIDWHRADAEWEAYSVEMLSAAGVVLLGRTTYSGFAAFWPAQDGEVARLLNGVRKVVASSTLGRADWRNTSIVRTLDSDSVATLKAGSTGDAIVLGSGRLAAGLSGQGLIDEYRLAINPVVLGGGTPLFPPGQRRDLALVATRVFNSGIALATYRPEALAAPTTVAA